MKLHDAIKESFEKKKKKERLFYVAFKMLFVFLSFKQATNQHKILCNVLWHGKFYSCPMFVISETYQKSFLKEN